MKYFILTTLLFFTMGSPIEISSSALGDEVKTIYKEIVEIKSAKIAKGKTLDSLGNYRYLADSIDLFRYLSIMSKAESNDNYGVVNSFGYMGKYQFGRATLRGLAREGFLSDSIASLRQELFLSSISAQEQAMLALTASNLIVLKNYQLDQCLGKKINGITITMEGLLAAAHLRGPYAVKQYVVSNGKINKTDAYGTSVQDYVSKFIS